jgi:hypothetical protein
MLSLFLNCTRNTLCIVFRGVIIYIFAIYSNGIPPYLQLHNINSQGTKCIKKRLRWSRGSVLAFGTQVRGFAPGRSRQIFRAKKIISSPSFGGEVKLSVSCRSFTACKRSLNVKWKSAFRQNDRTFLPHSSTFRHWVLSRGDTRGDVWWRKLERLT